MTGILSDFADPKGGPAPSRDETIPTGRAIFGTRPAKSAAAWPMLSIRPCVLRVTPVQEMLLSKVLWP